VLVDHRDDADDYIAFKHINGPNTWDPLAKAKFATKIFFRLKEHHGHNILDTLSRRIGDSKQLVLRLLVAYQILEQATAQELIHLPADRIEKLDFSHLYTSIQSPAARAYLGLGDDPLSVDQVRPNPVPKSHVKQLEHLMDWLFGGVDIEPIIQRQGTDRPKLIKVLANAVATETLQQTRDFERAVEEAGFGDEEWMKSVTRLEVTAKRVSDGISDLNDDFPKVDLDRGISRLEATARHVRSAQVLLADRFPSKK